jgi:peptide/nickel transport system substrate-binding protein
MRRFTTVLGVFVFLFSSSACTRVGTTSENGAALHSWTDPTTLRIGLWEEPDTLDPVVGTMAFSSDVFQLIFDGLIRYDDRGRPIPDLATELPTFANGGISRDGRTITYHLMPQARWSDGVPVTSADVVFTWQQIMNPRNAVVSRNGYDRIVRIETPDAHTVRIVLDRPYPPALFLFRDLTMGAIVPKHVLAGNASLNHVPFNARPVGSGPYVLREWEHGNEMRFDANPHYFRGVAKIPHVVLKFVPDQNTLVAELQAHEVDMYYSIGLSQLQRVRGLSGIKILSRPSLHWEHLAFNTEHPPLDDRRVRLALCYAIDENSIFAKIYHGEGRMAPTHFNPDFGYANPAATYYPYDLTKAAALLDRAGWKLGPDGMRAKDGVPLAISISTVAGVKQRESIEVLLQSAWRALGIDTTVKNFPAATLFAPASEGGVLFGGKTDVSLFTFEYATPDPDDSVYLAPDQVPPAGENVSFYRDAEIGRLEREGLATYDLAKRRAAYRRIGAILIAQVPEYVLDFLPEIAAVNVDLHGVRPAAIGSDLWNVADWSFAPGP